MFQHLFGVKRYDQGGKSRRARDAEGFDGRGVDTEMGDSCGGLALDRAMRNGHFDRVELLCPFAAAS